jgi:NADH-quinone oxidoreductase subunit N
MPTINLDTLGNDSLAFLPELVLCGTIVLLLVVRLFTVFDRLHLSRLALLGTVAALAVCVAQWNGLYDLPTPSDNPAQTAQTRIFSGLLAYDYLTQYLRLFLLVFTALIILLSQLTRIPDREDSADFYCLLLGATLGMMIMASANHLLMMYVGVEMASLPSYALAGFLKGRRQSSEAALKYVVYGGGAAGIMLYGISLLAGKFGTAYLPDLAVGYAATLGSGTADPILILGTLFVLIGIAFKLAAVPFHFWCPDVFEGAAAEVAGYLSVASKGAALAMLARVTLVLAGMDPLTWEPVTGAGKADWAGVVRYLVPALAVFAALTATFGNLAAYLQTNLKRLLAYSTIAHAGYMMMGLAPLTRDGVSAMLFYLAAYLFMNLGAFAVVAFLRNQTGSEDLADFRGLVRRSPWMVVTLSFFLLSLLGIPPLVGFAAKFQIFSVLWKAGTAYAEAGEPGLGWTLWVLLGVGGVNTVLSAIYYLKVMKVMILDERAEDLEGKEPTPLAEPAPAVAYAVLVTAVVAVGIALWDPVDTASTRGVARFNKPAVKQAALTREERQ